MTRDGAGRPGTAIEPVPPLSLVDVLRYRVVLATLPVLIAVKKPAA